MPPQPPVLLVDNYLDVVQLYRTASLLASSTAPGSDPANVIDCRRERSYWTPAAAGDRPHIDFTRNTQAGTNGRKLTGSGVLSNSTSHTFCFLVRSTVNAGAADALLYAAGADNTPATSLCMRRRTGGGLLGFYDGAEKNFGVAAPSDDAWHTLIYVFDGAAGTANLYIDGVAAGTLNVAYTPRTLNGAAGFCVSASPFANEANFSGKLGRILYYGGAQNAGGVALIHPVLLGENRDPASSPNSTATLLWDPLLTQGTQQVTETKQGKHLIFGDSSAVEWNSATNDRNDPFWGGGHWVAVSMPANQASPDTLWIDRGHNLWGQYVVVEGSSDPAGLTDYLTDRAWAAIQVPALDANGNYVPGGDPTVGFCVTEEGALWTLLSGAKTASLVWRVRVFAGSTSFVPVVPGIMLGKKSQLANFLSKFDEDAGERTEVSTDSRMLYAGTDTTYSRRTCTLAVPNIGQSEYDGTMRTLRRLLFAKNQPVVVVHNYGTAPERAWLYRYRGKTWSAPMDRVLRSVSIPLAELGPLAG